MKHKEENFIVSLFQIRNEVLLTSSRACSTLHSLPSEDLDSFYSLLKGYRDFSKPKLFQNFKNYFNNIVEQFRKNLKSYLIQIFKVLSVTFYE